ncbi:MAG TPA: hypothetical protein VN923_01920 [Thermoanaerobaculia bacterium]|nr:hypothetical protein [Thermoanaerobaculia bacterium]
MAEPASNPPPPAQSEAQSEEQSTSASAGDQPAENRLVNPDRPYWWLITYDLDPAFFQISAAEQAQLENADAEHGIEMAIELEWKAAYTTLDLLHGWIVMNLKGGGDAAAAAQAAQAYPMYKYLQNLAYTQIYSATEAGFNWKIVWGGFKEALESKL